MSALGGLLGDYDSDGSNASGKDGSVGGNEEGGNARPGTPNADAGEKEASILDKLPPPKVGEKRSVRFVLPFDLSSLGKNEDEDEDKAIKAVTKTIRKGKSKLLDYLPPPKRQSTEKAPALGAGQWKTSSTGAGSEEASIAVPTLSAQGLHLESNEMYRVESHDHGSCLNNDVPHLTNEMYRVDESGGFPVSSTSACDDGEIPPNPGRSSAMGNGPGIALEGESKKNQFKVNNPGHFGIEFKEIRQADLKHMDPAVRESATSIGTAFGSEYATQLRGQAAPFKGSKIAKRKHQIGTLYHTMKMNELESIASKAQGMKSKHETEAKYGWR